MRVQFQALAVVVVIMVITLVTGHPMPPWATVVLYFSAVSAIRSDGW